MTLSYTFVLPNANTWYNLWTLIVGTNNPNFVSNPVTYIPNMACAISYQNASAITNAANGGNILYVAFNNALSVGEELFSGAADKISSQSNTIALNSINFKNTNGGASVAVTIITI
jgi:hypothetical protein